MGICHPLLIQLIDECEKKFNDTPYVGGAGDLKVIVIDDNTKVKVNEYDGFESLMFRDETDWI